MNNFIDSNEIINFFDELNKNSIEYLLIRNMNDELPYKLERKKDIDILLKKDSKNIANFLRVINNNGFKKKLHPNRNDIFLYSCDKFIFYYNNKNKIYIDIQYELLCRSLNKGEWLPLDKKIQESAWKNKKQISERKFTYWKLSDEDELVTLIARSVLDKKEFLKNYKKRIEELYTKTNIENIIPKLKLIFFKYTMSLIQQIEERNFDNIVDNYYKFKEY